MKDFVPCFSGSRRHYLDNFVTRGVSNSSIFGFCGTNSLNVFSRLFGIISNVVVILKAEWVD